MSTVEQLYYNQIQNLPIAEQLQLITLVAQSLSNIPLADSASLVQTATHRLNPKHSIMELHGLGAEIWQGLDAQEYVDTLRDEWEQRSHS